MMAYGPGTSVKGAPYLRYFAEHELALMELAGPIYRRADSMETSGAQSTGGVLNALRAVQSGKVTTREIQRDAEGYPTGITEKEGAVKKLLITVDGPGGEATQVDEAAALVHEVSKTVETAVFVEGLAASAHYYIASGSPRIFSSRMGLVGSIGVVLGVPLPAGKTPEGRNILETPSGRQYVEFVSAKSKLKRADPASEEGMQYYQNIVDRTADIFLADVARYRGVAVETAHEKFGIGGVYDAGEARERGMIHEVGTFDEVWAAMTAGDLTAHGHAMTGASGAS